MDVPVFNMQGAEVGKLTIDEGDLGGEVNPALIKQAYVRYHANRRQGSARTKTRSDVEGSTRKIYRQKGTGRARHGARTANIFRGGGHTFAKKRSREDYRLDMPKKMRRKANRNALLAKLLDGEVKVLDDLRMDKPRTKAFMELLRALGVDRTALVAVDGANAGVRLSARNIEDVSLCRPSDMTCFEMLNHRYLVISRPDLEAWLSGPVSQTGKDAKINPMGRRDGAEAA